MVTEKGLEMAKDVKAILQVNHMLTHLALCTVKTDPEGEFGFGAGCAKEIAEGLDKNQTLLHLDLSL